jgi:hypothetical protein
VSAKAAGPSEDAIREQFLALARISTRRKAKKLTKVSKADKNAKAMKQAERREKKADIRAEHAGERNTIQTEAKNKINQERVDRVERAAQVERKKQATEHEAGLKAEAKAEIKREVETLSTEAEKSVNKDVDIKSKAEAEQRNKRAEKKARKAEATSKKAELKAIKKARKKAEKQYPALHILLKLIRWDIVVSFVLVRLGELLLGLVYRWICAV